MSRVKLSKVLPKQLPEFVREEYPLFIKFLEYYYQYLDEQEVDLKTVRDLDETADKFVQNIKNEINFIGSFTETNPTLNEKTLLTHIGSAYRAKGSDESVKTLMRSIFNKDVEVMYPGEYMLRASDGKWQQDTSLFVNITAGDPTTLVGEEISVSGEGKNVRVIVQRTAQYSGQLYEIFVDKNFVGEIKAGYTISFEGVTGYVANTTAASSIIRSGAGFRLGQIYEVKSNTGVGTRIKVTGVDSSGGITKYVIINFGTGYLDDFYATITPPVYDSYTTQSTSPLTISKTSSGVTTVQNSVSGSETQGFTDYGTIINPNYWAPEYSNGTYVGTKLRGFYNEQLKSLSNDYAVIEFRLGAVARYPGSYVKNDGFLSDAARIQDSRYYQAYSYVIRIDELLNSFKDAVKTYVHPAGMALFSDFEVKNYISLNATVQAVINFLRRKFEDDFTAYDEIAFKEIYKYLTDVSIVTEQRRFAVTKPLPEETLTVGDTVAKEFGKNVQDSFTTAESISEIILNKVINETAIASEAYSLVVTKGAFTDSVVITDEFDIQQDHIAAFTDSSAAVDSGGFYVVNPYNYDQLYFAEQYANTRTTF